MIRTCLKNIRRFSTQEPKFILKYGLNPTNLKAGYYFKTSKKFDVLNGDPSYINILDAMLGWNLVNEVKDTLNMTACASYKHNSPAGVSCLGQSTHHVVKHARQCDSLSSFGDFIAVNDIINGQTANYLKTQVSDGIIASGFTDEALGILKKKKGHKYVILKGYDTENEGVLEFRDHFGVTLYQSVNNSPLPNLQNLDEHKKTDALLGWITLKYTPSNSVNFTTNKQVVGVGAGQQNRVACIRLAGDKCGVWEDNNCKHTDEYLTYTMCSDGFLPFKDNIDIAKDYNVNLILQPGGSIRDDEIKDEAHKHAIQMIYTNQRTFYH